MSFFRFYFRLLFLFPLGIFVFVSGAYAISSRCKESLSDPYQKVQCVHEDLSGRNFSGAYMPKGLFNASTLRNTVFDRATLNSAQFIKAVFNERSSFMKAELSQALFLGAKFYRTHFEDATLLGAQFKGSTLTGVNFQRANLTYARFQGASIQDADFRDAHLMGANLSQTNGFSDAHWKEAEYDNRTVFPKGFPSDLKAQMKPVRN